MLRALLLGTARGMQRVGEQEQGFGCLGLFGTEHAGLTSAVGVAAEKNLADGYFLHRFNGIPEAGAVAGGVARAGRAKRSCLTIGQIAAENGESCSGKYFGESDQQWGLRVGASAVREDETVTIWSLGKMKKTADVRFYGILDELAIGGLGQDIILASLLAFSFFPTFRALTCRPAGELPIELLLIL